MDNSTLLVSTLIFLYFLYVISKLQNVVVETECVKIFECRETCVTIFHELPTWFDKKKKNTSNNN